MNALQATAISVVAPYLIELAGDVIKDAINPQGVIEFRDKIINHVTDFVKETKTNFDDSIVKIITEKIFTVENYLQWGKKLLAWIKQYVQHTATKWDDYCVPLIDILEDIFLGAGESAEA